MTPEQYARVRELFLQARELDDAARTELLHSACDDPRIRKEVESLLNHANPETIISKNLTAASQETVPQTSATLRHQGQLATSASRVFGTLKRNVAARSWLLAILVCLLVGSALTFWVLNGIRGSIRSIEEGRLNALLVSDVDALTFWLRSEQDKVSSWANDADVVDSAKVLLTDATAESQAARIDAHGAIRRSLDHAARDRDQDGSPDEVYVIWNPAFTVISASAQDEAALGERATELGATLLTRVFRTHEPLVVTPHFPSSLSPRLVDADQPVMAVMVPIQDGTQVIAVMLVRGIGLEQTFEAILSRRETGASGESYAFNGQALMLSRSRFDDQLRRVGLLPDDPHATSVLTVYLRDPGGNLLQGRGRLPGPSSPLTRMAASAVHGESGADLDGYRDYRGVRVVGVWEWLEEFDFGVASEIDYDEAFAPLWYLRTAYRAWLVLSLGSLVAIAWSATSLLRGGPRVKRLGAYTLEQKIGEGGMGTVYRARHDMLKRPTAVKMLKPAIANDTNSTRFQREAELASQLTHPNTIAIYDYGCTDEGIYFYAMEYLSGLNLAELVKIEGRLPAPRVAYLLKQICSSLREAHELGLVHRDIKPQNIMVCDRGGEFDFVKVLDFGLIKHVEPRSATVTSTVLTGTPQYMAPERLRDPKSTDPRSDIYSLGVVAFNLLTGKSLFAGDDTSGILENAAAVPPPSMPNAERPSGLNQLVMDCLSSEPERRPQSMAQMLERLDKLDDLESWTQDDARSWWLRQAERIRLTITERAVDAIVVPADD